MDGLSEEFKQMVTLYGSAFSQEGSASSDEKPKYKLLRDKYFKEAPFVMYYIDTSSAEYGYKFGYELLLLGAFVTILGLCLTTIGKSSK